MTAEPLKVGDRYELAGLLGRGGMAEVRQALDTRLSRQVAVKQLRPDLAVDPTFQARFRREAQSAAGLNHPNIVAVYDTGEEPDPTTGVSVPYIVMELVEGPTLRDVLREGRKILPERALELSQGVLDALSYSHRAGIVHRDIKPANVMLTPTGTVKVMDFGIARAVADTSATMTQTAAVIGTAQYLSPEQARGETVDARSDIYSAGCLLYELLVRRPPFVGESPVSVAYQHVRERPVPPSELDPLIGPDIDAITLKALAKAPGDRYQTAREMKADMTRLLAGQQVTAALPVVRDEEPEPTRVRTAVVPAPDAVVEAPLPTHPDDIEEPRRRGGVIALVVALVLVLLAGGAYGTYRFLQPAAPVATPQVEVPAVTGFAQGAAESTLRNRGFKSQSKNVSGADDSTVGEVTDQTPKALVLADKGSTVTIEVNVGPKMVDIPDNLLNKDRDDVKKVLKDAGFDVNEVASTSTDDPTAVKDSVLATDPLPGTPAPEGSTVTVTYATGKGLVPSVTGFNLEQATSTLAASGFDNLATPTEREDATATPGTVLDASPRAGKIVDRDTEIKLVLAKAPPQTTAPPTDSTSPSPTATTTPTTTPTSTPTETPTG